MKKHVVLVFCMLLSAFSSAFTVQPKTSTQEKICYWQKIKETENTSVASTAPDASVSLNGSTVTINWQGLNIVHYWTAPGEILTPGDKLAFEVSTSWSLDSGSDLNSVGGLNTYINFNFADKIEAQRKSVNFSQSPSGSVENSTVWTVWTGTEGQTIEIIGFADAAVAGGNVRYKYEYVCFIPTPVPTETPQTSATPLDTPTATATPIQCKELSEEEKLSKILALYYERIPKGIVESGEKNNILDFLGYPGHNEFVCGGYQSKVIDFLAKIKFSDDPCEQALLDKWDYGPIHAWNGYHQAVVIYPWATNWMETGIVLDPWIEQRPMAYPMDEWAIHFSYAGLMGAAGRFAESSIDGSFIGIGPSEEYEKSPEFPMFGGTYAMPGSPRLTKEENVFLKTLPESKQELFKKLSKTQQKYWLSLKMDGKDSAQQLVADCPLVLYVENADGLRSGIANDGVYFDLDDVLYSAFLLEDGTLFSELIYPLESGYRLVMEGTGDGNAYVMVQDWVDFERSEQGVAFYALAVKEGVLYESMMVQESLFWEGGSLQPQHLSLGEYPDWLDAQPSLAAVGGKIEPNTSLPDWLPGWRVLFLGGFGGLLLALAGLVVLGVLVVPQIIPPRKATIIGKVENGKKHWLLSVIILIVSCLIMTCSAVSLYLGIANRG